MPQLGSSLARVPEKATSTRSITNSRAIHEAKFPSRAKTAAADSKDKNSPGPIARFFHHSGKSEEEASKDAEIHRDAPELDAHHKKKHGHLRPR